MVVSVGVLFAKVGAYFFIRHPVDGEFSLNIPGNLWSTSFYEGRTNYVSLPTYPAASLMYMFMLFVVVSDARKMHAHYAQVICNIKQQ